MNTNNTMTMKMAAEAFDSGDHETAFSIAERLALAGDPQAQWLLSQMYKAGNGVKQNGETAMAFLNGAAAGGWPEAQAELGFAYLDEEEQDLPQAVAWLLKAAAQGNPDARRFLKTLGTELGIHEETKAGTGERARSLSLTSFRQLISDEIASFIEVRRQVLEHSEHWSQLPISSVEHGEPPMDIDMSPPLLVGDKTFYAVIWPSGDVEPAPFGFQLGPEDERCDSVTLSTLSRLTPSGLLRFVPLSSNFGAFSDTGFELEGLAESDVWDELYETLQDQADVISPALVIHLVRRIGGVLEGELRHVDIHTVEGVENLEDFLRMMFQNDELVSEFIRLSMDDLQSAEDEADPGLDEATQPEEQNTVFAHTEAPEEAEAMPLLKINPHR